MRPAALLLPALLAIVAACSTTPPPTTPPSGAPEPTPTAPASEAPSPSSGPTTPPASPTDAPPPAATPSPTGTPDSAMTPEEVALLAALRLDAAVDCVPRRADLPDGALHGIECRPDDQMVERVGIYWFSSPTDAAHAYMTRMASYGVDVNAGDCNRDVPGDAPWTAGDHEGDVDDPGVFNWESSVLSPNRSGCFRDENGTANVRVTCGNAYVGILGTGADLSALSDWAWRYPDGFEPGTPAMPGVCVGADLAALSGSAVR